MSPPQRPPLATVPLATVPLAAVPLAAVVVTYNRRAHLQATIARLRAAGCDRIVAVDNGSADGSRDWLAGQADAGLEPIFTDANLGGAGGFAAGLDHLRQENWHGWTVLLDDDARPEPGALAVFRAMDRDGIDGIAAAVRYPAGESHGKICDMNRPLRNPFGLPLRRRGFRIPDSAYDKDALQNIDMATFVGFFLSPRALKASRGPDPRLFIYGDDLLFTLSLSQAGMRLVFAPQIRFEHDCQTLSGPQNIYRPPWKVYYHYRNAILLYRQAAGWLFWPVLLARLPRWVRMGRHYGEGAPEFRRLFWRAIRDGISGRLDDPPENIPGPPRP